MGMKCRATSVAKTYNKSECCIFEWLIKDEKWEKKWNKSKRLSFLQENSFQHSAKKINNPELCVHFGPGDKRRQAGKEMQQQRKAALSLSQILQQQKRFWTPSTPPTYLDWKIFCTFPSNFKLKSKSVIDQDFFERVEYRESILGRVKIICGSRN